MVKAEGCVRLTTYRHPVPLSCNLGTLTSWNPLGHSRPVTGLIFLYKSTSIIQCFVEKRKFRIHCGGKKLMKQTSY